MTEEELEKKRKLFWSRFISVLKYSAGIVIAAISVYGAKQEKGREALDKLRASYEEQSKAVLSLQQVVKILEVDRKHLYRQCQKEMDGVRSNMTFFLMGLAKPSSQREMVDTSEAKKLLKALLKETPSQFVPQDVKFKPLRPFDKIDKE